MYKRVLTRKTARIIERQTTINLENIDPNSWGTSVLFRNVTNRPFGRRRSLVSTQQTTVRHVAVYKLQQIWCRMVYRYHHHQQHRKMMIGKRRTNCFNINNIGQ